MIKHRYYEKLKTDYDLFTKKRFCDFLREEWEEITTYLLMDLIETAKEKMTMEDLKNAIEDHDSEYPDKNDSKRIVSSHLTENWDLTVLDISALCKLISYVLYSNDNPFRSIIYEIRNIRNMYSHKGRQDDVSPDQVTPCMEKIEKHLGNLSYYTGKSSYSEIRSARNEFEIIKQKYKPVVHAIIQDINIYRYKKKPQKDQEIFHLKHLLSYRIFLDETSLLGKYGPLLLNKIINYHKGRLYITNESRECIKEIADNGDRKKLRTARDVVRILSNNKNSFCWIRDAEKRQGYVYPGDIIQEYVLSDEGHDYCVITEDIALIRAIQKENKPNVLIAIPISDCEFERNIAKRQDLLHEFADDPVVFDNIFRFVPAEASAEQTECNADSSETQQNEALLFEVANSKSTPQYEPSVSNETPADAQSEKPEPTRIGRSAYDGTEDPVDDIQPVRQKQKQIRLPKEQDTVILSGIINDEVVLLKEWKRGGEGILYSITKYGSLIVKIYLENKLTSERIKKLKAMVEVADQGGNEGICWPLALVYDPSGKNIIGYAMERIENAQTITEFLEDTEAITRADLVQCCIDIASRFLQLHQLFNGNILMGDVNPKNILYDLKQKKAYFIDVDSYQFYDFTCPVYTLDYLSPRLIKDVYNKKIQISQNKRTLYDERFAVAVLYFYILFLKEYPFENNEKVRLVDSVIRGYFSFDSENARQTRRSYIWQNQTEEVRKAFKQVFSEKRHNLNDGDWIKLFSFEKDRIEGFRLSNECFPTCALENEADSFELVKCDLCGKSFACSKSQREREQRRNDRCPTCLRKQQLARSIILSADCSICGCQYTINLYDLSDRDSSRLVCPDCDARAYFTGKQDYYKDGDQTEYFPEQLTEALQYAYQNLRKRRY